MSSGLFLAAIGLFGYTRIGSVVSGLLLIESIPRRPQETDHVILRCYPSPTRIYFRLDCQFEWSWAPTKLQPPAADRTNDPQLALLPVAPWWKVSNQDVSDSGSVIVINEMKPEHQGHYVCQLSCVGRKKESITLTLEIGEDSGRLITEQNSRIAYLTTGVVFSVIILATVLRFFCVNARECCCLPNKDDTSSNISSSGILRNQFDSSSQFVFSSVDTVWLKPSTDRRPTILDKNVWLPPYEAALKYPRLFRPITTPVNTVGRPPTYKEALVALVDPRHYSHRNETV